MRGAVTNTITYLFASVAAVAVMMGIDGLRNRQAGKHFFQGWKNRLFQSVSCLACGLLFGLMLRHIYSINGIPLGLVFLPVLIFLLFRQSTSERG